MHPLPERGWELEEAGPVGSKTPIEASPVPYRMLDHNPQETPPVRREKVRIVGQAMPVHIS